MNDTLLSFRIYNPADYLQLKRLMEAAYSDLENPATSEQEMDLLLAIYPQGQIVAELDGQIIGANIGRVLPYDVYIRPHTQEEIIDVARYVSDTISGDCAYGMDIFINPEYHNLKIGQQLIKIFIEATRIDNFKAMIGISRLSKYHLYQHEFSVEEYVQKVCNKELYDPALSFHLRYGANYVCMAANFSPDDTNSLGYGVILELVNPNYNPNLPTYPNRTNNLARLK